jgi:hypothetical protein
MTLTPKEQKRFDWLRKHVETERKREYDLHLKMGSPGRMKPPSRTLEHSVSLSAASPSGKPRSSWPLRTSPGGRNA